MRVAFYADFATSPSQLTKFVTDDEPDGISVTDGAYYLTITLSGSDDADETDGVVSVPVPIQWKNAIQARITSSRPDGDLRILDAQFVLTKGGEASDVGT
jgi:hypothetical protein